MLYKFVLANNFECDERSLWLCMVGQTTSRKLSGETKRELNALISSAHSVQQYIYDIITKRESQCGMLMRKETQRKERADRGYNMRKLRRNLETHQRKSCRAETDAT